MSHNHTPDDQRELDEVQKELDQARAASDRRSVKVDDITSRFRELMRKKHFRLMLEELFND
jgi:hypothetical protein